MHTRRYKPKCWILKLKNGCRGHQNSGGSRIFERGFQFQVDKNANPVWVEDEKKVISFHSHLSQQSSFSHIAIISNKTTVIRVFRSDCSIRVFELTGLKSISNGGFRGNLETPLRSTTAKVRSGVALYQKNSVEF